MHSRCFLLVKQNGWLWLWLTAVVVIVDQLSKAWVTSRLLPGQTIAWTSWFNIHLAFNTGAAYGFLGGQSGWQMPLFVVITLAVSIILFIWLGRIRRNQYTLCAALSLIIGGALGNLIDRLRLSYVVDFFDFHIGSWHFATFNVADAAITVGAALMLIYFFFLDKAS